MDIPTCNMCGCNLNDEEIDEDLCFSCSEEIHQNFYCVSCNVKIYEEDDGFCIKCRVESFRQTLYANTYKQVLYAIAYKNKHIKGLQRTGPS